MKKYIVVYENSYKRAVTLSSYFVEANNMAEALEKIDNGEGEQTEEEFLGGTVSEQTVHDVTEF